MKREIKRLLALTVTLSLLSSMVPLKVNADMYQSTSPQKGSYITTCEIPERKNQ